MNRYYDKIIKSKENPNNINDQSEKSTKATVSLGEEKSNISSLKIETKKKNHPQIFFPDDKPNLYNDEMIYVNVNPKIPKLLPRINRNEKPKYTVNTQCNVSSADLKKSQSSNIKIEDPHQSAVTKEMDSNMKPVPTQRTRKNTNILQRQSNVDIESPNCEVMCTKLKYIPTEESCDQKINPENKDNKTILEQNIANDSISDFNSEENEAVRTPSSSTNESLDSEFEFNSDMFDINNRSITDSIDQDFLAKKTAKPRLLPLISITSTDESTNYLSLDNDFLLDSTYCALPIDVKSEYEPIEQSVKHIPVPRKRICISNAERKNPNAPDEICFHNSNYEILDNVKKCKDGSNVSEKKETSIPIPRPRPSKSNVSKKFKNSIYRSCEYVNDTKNNRFTDDPRDHEENFSCEIISTADSFRNNLLYSRRTCESLNDLTFDSKIQNILNYTSDSKSDPLNGSMKEEKLNRNLTLKKLIKRVKKYFKSTNKERKEKNSTKFYTD